LASVTVSNRGHDRFWRQFTVFDICGPVQMTHRALASKEEEHCVDWIDQNDGHQQVSISTKVLQASTYI